MKREFVFLIEPDQEVKNRIREAFKETSEREYQGWYHEYDKTFDEQATWFASFGNSDELTALRVIQKTQFNDLPFENGLVNASKHYAKPGDVEISGVAFPKNRPNELYPILIEVLLWIMTNVPNGRCFAIADRKVFEGSTGNNFFRTLYQQVLAARDLEELVQFEGFNYLQKSGEQPVSWKLFEILINEIPDIVRRMNSR